MEASPASTDRLRAPEPAPHTERRGGGAARRPGRPAADCARTAISEQCSLLQDRLCSDCDEADSPDREDGTRNGRHRGLDDDGGDADGDPAWEPSAPRASVVAPTRGPLSPAVRRPRGAVPGDATSADPDPTHELRTGLWDRRKQGDPLPTEVWLLIADALNVRERRALAATCAWAYRSLRGAGVAVLRPQQVGHYYRMTDILSRHVAALDLSPMGSGKTWTSAALAVDGRFEVVAVVCPKTVAPRWRETLAAVGLERATVVTYAALRFSATRAIRAAMTGAPLAGRRPAAGKGAPGTGPAGSTASAATRTPTSAAETPEAAVAVGVGEAEAEAAAAQPAPGPKATPRRTLLIFDECQALKNATAQFRKALKLVRLARSKDAAAVGCRTLLLSASPLDNERQCANFLRLLGIVTAPRMAAHRAGVGYVADGFLELALWCPMRALEHERTIASLSRANERRLVLDLFRRYVRPELAAAMPPPPIPFALAVCNAFYDAVDDGRAALDAGMQDLARQVEAWNEVPPDWGAVGRALALIELGKAFIVAREAARVLDSDPMAKVICLLTFSCSLESVLRALAHYHPLDVRGRTSRTDRSARIAEFASDPSRRLFVGSLRVCALGLDLHDTTGRHPRTMLICPNFAILDMYQATHRVHRLGTASPSTVRFVYCKSHIDETRLLTAVAKRCRALRAFVSELPACRAGETSRQQARPLYPSEYPHYMVEGDREMLIYPAWPAGADADTAWC